MILLWVRMMCDRHSHRFMAPPSVHSSGPGANLSAAYFEARYQILREPLGFPPSAAKLPDDDAAIHAWIETKQVEPEDEVMVVAVGRIHLIPADSTGASVSAVSLLPSLTTVSCSVSGTEGAGSGVETISEILKPKRLSSKSILMTFAFTTEPTGYISCTLFFGIVESISEI